MLKINFQDFINKTRMFVDYHGLQNLQKIAEQTYGIICEKIKSSSIMNLNPLNG